MYTHIHDNNILATVYMYVLFTFTGVHVLVPDLCSLTTIDFNTAAEMNTVRRYSSLILTLLDTNFSCANLQYNVLQ